MTTQQDPTADGAPDWVQVAQRNSRSVQTTIGWIFWASLATGGRICVIGVGAGFKAEVNLLALMGKRGRIHGSTLRARPLEDKAAAAQAVIRHVVPLLADGRLQVPVADTFALSDAGAAYERFAAGNKFGKVVLVTDA